MVKLHFFDPEHVERDTPARPWRAIVVAALIATAALTAGYEFFWRAKGMAAGDYNNTEGLWAEARREATGEATVIVGSSRIFFGADLDVWEAATGERPVQLALQGTSPRVFLTDLANDESFRGLVVVGVTVPIFFTRDGGLRADYLQHYRNETLAERADHEMMKRLESVFAFLDEQSRPKRQIRIWPMPLRDGMAPRFDPRKLEALGPDRNAHLWERVEWDERYREEAKAMWALTLERRGGPGPDGKAAPNPRDLLPGVLAEVKANVDKIRARGGDVAFVRFPYGGAYTAAEDNGFPREIFWDQLGPATNTATVTWHDYPSLQGYTLPEWSHLSKSEATRFTTALVPILAEEIEKKRAER